MATSAKEPMKIGIINDLPKNLKKNKKTTHISSYSNTVSVAISSNKMSKKTDNYTFIYDIYLSHLKCIFSTFSLTIYSDFLVFLLKVITNFSKK